MNDDKDFLTREDFEHCDKPLTNDWKKEFNYAGSFQYSLMQTIAMADEINLKKIRLIYPNLVNLYKKFRGDLK